MTCPVEKSINGPPEFPPLMGASVCIHIRPHLFWLPETMPRVPLNDSEKGWPKAATGVPIEGISLQFRRDTGASWGIDDVGIAKKTYLLSASI